MGEPYPAVVPFRSGNIVDRRVAVLRLARQSSDRAAQCRRHVSRCLGRTLVAGWFVYDALCRLLGRWPLALGVSVYAFLVLATWGLFHLFGARAAYIHAGAIIGTIMAANVLFVIIPGQRKMVDAIRKG